MSKRDEFDDPEGFFSRLITVNDDRPRLLENRTLVFSAVVFGVVVALSGVIWASYPSQSPLTGDGTVPVIRADVDPYKVEPTDRGGMDVAHKDSTIFDAMRDGAPDRRVENLLADTTDEQPIDRAVLFAGLKTDLADATQNSPSKGDSTTTNAKAAGDVLARMGDYQSDRPMTESERRESAAKRNAEALKQPADPLPSTTSPVVTAPVPVAPPDSSEEIADEPIESAAPTEPAKPSKGFQETPAPVKTAAEDPKPKPEPTPTKPASVAVKTGVGSAYVQVASVPNEKQIKSEWGVVSGKLPMIKGLPYRVQKADLGAKGVYHRIQVGPMSGDDATKLCASIKAQKPGGCLVVK